MEQHLSSETFEHNSDNKIGEELLETPVIEISNEDREIARSDNKYVQISDDAVHNAGEEKNSDLKVYAICCAIVVLYKLYNLSM